MARLGVHQDEERVGLLGAAAHDVLQGGDVLERVQRHHAVVVVARQQEHGGILDTVVLRDADVVERGVPAAVSEGTSRKEEAQTQPILFIYKHDITRSSASPCVCVCFNSLSFIELETSKKQFCHCPV